MTNEPVKDWGNVAGEWELVAGELFGALKSVRGIIADGAMTGFLPLEGDWAERLYASQQNTSRALSTYEAKR